MDPIEIQGHCLRFGEKLRRIRREVGISMETLGNRAGLHRTEIGHLEHARREPRLTTIFRVAHALDMSASRLLEDIDRFEGDENSDLQPLVAVRGPRRRPQGGEEDPARAGSSTTCLGPRRATNDASSDSGDRGSLRPG
jgi:transcriptional regulator with XRE-family HTH domain